MMGANDLLEFDAIWVRGTFKVDVGGERFEQYRKFSKESARTLCEPGQ